jgi:hypothetical protein
MFSGSVTSPFLRQPGYQACDLTRGFASPPHNGFAFIEKGSSLELVSSWAINAVPRKKCAALLFPHQCTRRSAC